MTTARRRKSRLGGIFLSLLLAGAIAGCGAGHTTAATRVGGAAVSPTPTTAAAESGAPSATPSSAPSAATATQLTSVDAQLKSLDGELATSDSGLGAQEGDPTK